MAEVEIEDSIYAPNNGQKDYPICTAFQSDPEDRTPPPRDPPRGSGARTVGATPTGTCLFCYAENTSEQK